MKNKIIVGTILIIFICIGMFPLIRAESTPTHEELFNSLNFIGKINYYSSRGFFFFTTQGNLRRCGYNEPAKCSGNPIWCGQPDDIFERPKGYIITKTEAMQNCPTDRNKGAFLNLYFYDGYFLEVDMTNRNSYTLPNGAAIEVYCCTCYTPEDPDCKAPQCTHGQKEQFVCRAGKICYSYCNNGIWVDRCETCPSGTVCIQPPGQSASCKVSECVPGNTKCEGQRYFYCAIDGKWQDRGFVEGFCGYTTQPGQPGDCITKEDTFYSKGKLSSETKVLCWADKTSTVGSFEDNIELVKKELPLIHENYFSNKDTACCSGLAPIYIEKNKASKTATGGWTLLPCYLILPNKFTIEYEYNIYKCVSEEEAKGQFCVDFIHDLIQPITNDDSCQTNTIIGIVAAIVILMLLASILGGRR